MAEAVVSVLSKLAVIIANEAQYLGEVRAKVERVQRELTRIKCCLEDADSKRKGDERVQNWLNDLRDAAYRIEDAIDTFFLHVGYTDARFSQKLIRLCNKPRDLYFLHKLGTKLDDIQNLLEEISKSRVTYGISDLKDKSKGEANVIMPHRRATYQEVDETEVVGMQADKNKILELLRRDHTPRRAVITIIGPGGLGKTTLSHMVYQSAWADFDYQVMLSISQQFSLTDILRKMLPKDSTREIQTVENETVGELINKVKSFLSNKRYLIILDDVWKEDLWNLLKDALPDKNNGSRVLITSRIIDVATSADSQMKPYELKYLNDRESLDLLLKKALPYQEPTQKCPTDLLKLAEKLSNKCKGLPLGLVVLGGILSTKGPSYTAWERVLETMNWYLDGSDCMRILLMSYEDMPYYLKACFQYLASFPEDHVINANRLMRMWIAEGFIPLEGRPTIEIMAEDCLEELSKRSMVQVLSRHVNGLIKNIQVHDLIRDLAMNEARHENMLTVFSQASADNKPDKIIRRASLQAEEKSLQFIEYVGPNTRSLFLFDPDGYFERSLHCSNFMLLKVLEIVATEGGWDKIELKSLDELIHLKYLGLRDCQINRCSVHGMKSLETLELQGSWYKKFDGLWTISTLRHVLVDNPKFISGPIPKGTTIFNLQTLKSVYDLDVCDAKLPNLRTLGIKNSSEKWVSMTNLFQTLRNLRKFDVHCGEHVIPMEIVYPKALPNYHNLQSLYLKGKWPENVNVEARLLPPQLIKLSLENSRLKQNPMKELGKLNSLKKLCLRHGVLTSDWKGPIICPEGFPALQYLIVDYHKMELMVAEGVMPKLTYLQVHLFTEVQLPPELQHVTVEKLVDN